MEKVCPAPTRASALRIGRSIPVWQFELTEGSKVEGFLMRIIAPARIFPTYRLPSGPMAAASGTIGTLVPVLGSEICGHPPAAFLLTVVPIRLRTLMGSSDPRPWSPAGL